MISRSRIAEVCRYGATGVLGVGLNVLIVVLLTKYLDVHYLASLAISSIVVTLVGFFLNRTWTFRQADTAIAPELLRYSAATAMQLSLSLAACAWLVSGLHVHYALAIALVGVVSAPLIYLVHRGWSFGLNWLRET